MYSSPFDDRKILAPDFYENHNFMVLDSAECENNISYSLLTGDHMVLRWDS